MVLLRKFIGRSCLSRTCVIAATAVPVALFGLCTPIASAGQSESGKSASQVGETQAGPVPICHGDCNGDGDVKINEIVQLVALALGTSSSVCPGNIPGIGSIVGAVDSALRGCRAYTYRLTAGSRIRYTPPGDASGQVIDEPLAGTFSLVQVDAIDGVGSTRSIFTSFELESPSFRIARTGPGELRSVGVSIEGGVVSSRLPVAINAEEVILQGDGTTLEAFSCEDGSPLPCNAPSFNFSGLEVCGVPGTTLPCNFCTRCEDIRAGMVGGYSVTLFAAPEA